ncbi:MAG: ferrous iron transport protein A [Phycisphaerae bacterium]|nr:ferrous iron transport protein A [Phycisphaerae bacterium]
MEKQQLRPLALVKAGEKVRIIDIQSGREMKSRLAAIGMLPNVEVTVMNNGHPGPFVVNVCNSRMVLGRGMAGRIFVK